MYNFDVYEVPGPTAILEPLPTKRQWGYRSALSSRI